MLLTRKPLQLRTNNDCSVVLLERSRRDYGIFHSSFVIGSYIRLREHFSAHHNLLLMLVISASLALSCWFSAANARLLSTSASALRSAASDSSS